VGCLKDYKAAHNDPKLSKIDNLVAAIRNAGSGLEILTTTLRIIVEYMVYPFSYFKT
jgi:hypothetical protein